MSKIYTQARSVMMRLGASGKEILIHWAHCATLYDIHHQERIQDPCMDNLEGHVRPEAIFGLQRPHSPIARIDHRNGMGTPARPYSFAKAGPRRCSGVSETIRRTYHDTRVAECARATQAYG
jgi:hypothetical protein